MGANKRYSAQIERRQDERLAQAQPGPQTLPQQAYGGVPIQWTTSRPPVWVWVHFPNDKPAERRRGYVKGHNDRICVVWVDGPGGGWEITVWRNAVTHRTTKEPRPAQ